MKAEKWLEKIAATAAAAGISLDVNTAHEGGEDSTQASRQGDAVIYFFENPTAFKKAICWNESCGEMFFVNRQNVRCCSEKCRVQAYEERYGIKWDVSRPPAERWASLGGEPLCIPFAALTTLISLAQEQQSLAAVSH